MPMQKVAHMHAQFEISWAGVYISIVSTKIPYGGPNKEYIGDEEESLQKAVRDSIMKCCVQLKVRVHVKAFQAQETDPREHMAGMRAFCAVYMQEFPLTPTLTPACPPQARLVRSEALRQQRDRQESLRKYIPHVARSLFGILEAIQGDGGPMYVCQKERGEKRGVGRLREKQMREKDS